jgi:hypothetical protein
LRAPSPPLGLAAVSGEILGTIHLRKRFPDTDESWLDFEIAVNITQVAVGVKSVASTVTEVSQL